MNIHMNYLNWYINIKNNVITKKLSLGHVRVSD